MGMLQPEKRKIYLEAGADALFLETDFLRRYLTGFYSTDGYVVLNGENCYFFADPRYFEAAEKALKDSPVTVVAGTYQQALEALAGARTVGVPFPLISLSRAEELRKKGFTLCDCMPALKTAMEYKTERELALIEKACSIAEDALLRLMPLLKEDMTESETAALLEYEMRKLGASGVSFETIVAFGAGSSVPHHETGETKLKFGDVVLIDFGCKTEGYCSDCTRTFLFGDDGRHGRFKQVYAEVLKAHELVKETVTAGMSGKEADEVARASLRAAGLDGYFTHSLGHGIGLQIHEYPVLSPKGEEILQDGMVFSDEPGVYFAGEFGVRIEDSCYMKDGKVRSFMHKTSRELLIL